MKKIVFIALFFGLVQSLFCQTWQLQWQNCFGGSDDDEAYDIIPTSGGYLVAGATMSTDGDVSYNHGGDDGWLMSIDKTGALKWEKTYGGSLGEGIFRIFPTSDSCFYLLCVSCSSDGDISTDPYPNTCDYWVVKVDSTGAILWEKILGGNGLDQPTDGCITTDGGIVVIGYSNSDDGDVTNHYGKYDMWMVKLNAQGEKQWDFTLGNEYYDYPGPVIQTSDGGFLVGGSSKFTQGGNLSCNLHGGAEAVIVKLDSLRNIEWTRCYGGSGDEGVSRVIEVPDGYVFGAYASSYDGQVTGFNGGDDMWIVKIDFDGNIVWQKCLGGTREEFVKNISVESDGSYVVFGVTQSNDGAVSGNHNIDPTVWDVWVVRLSAGGELVSQQCIGGGGDEQLEFGVVQKGDSDYVVAGQTWYGPSYDVTCNSNQAAPDYWVFEIKDTAVGLSEPPAAGATIEVSPNPSKEWAVFSYTLPLMETKAVLGITDAQGRQIGTYTLQGREGQKLVDVRNLNAGIYFYTLTSTTLSKSGKFVVSQ